VNNKEESDNNVNIVLIQGGSNMTGTNCDLFTHKSSRSYLNHLVLSNNRNISRYVLKILPLDAA
jgi:hypothetical protein